MPLMVAPRHKCTYLVASLRLCPVLPLHPGHQCPFPHCYCSQSSCRSRAVSGQLCGECQVLEEAWATRQRASPGWRPSLCLESWVHRVQDSLPGLPHEPPLKGQTQTGRGKPGVLPRGRRERTTAKETFIPLQIASWGWLLIISPWLPFVVRNGT